MLRMLGYFAMFLVIGAFAALIGPTLPDLAENAQVSLSTAGLLFTARSLGYLVGALLAGRAYGRVRGHPLAAGALLLLAGLVALAPLTNDFRLLLALLLLVGAGMGTVDLGGNTLLLWSRRGQAGPYLNALHFCFGAGALLAPLVVAQVRLSTGGFAWSYWLLAAGALPVAAWLLLQPSPPAPAGQQPRAEHVHASPLLRSTQRLALLMAAFFVLYVGVEMTFGGWIYTYAVTRLEIPPGSPALAGAAGLTSAFWGALTAGRLIAIPLAARLRQERLLAIDLGGAVLSLAALLFLPGSAMVLWLGTLGLGLSLAAMYPTMLSLAARQMNLTSQVTSLFLVGAGVGGMTIPWLAGRLFASFGANALMAALLLVAIALAGVFGVIQAKTRHIV